MITLDQVTNDEDEIVTPKLPQEVMTPKRKKSNKTKRSGSKSKSKSKSKSRSKSKSKTRNIK